MNQQPPPPQVASNALEGYSALEMTGRRLKIWGIVLSVVSIANFFFGSTSIAAAIIGMILGICAYQGGNKYHSPQPTRSFVAGLATLIVYQVIISIISLVGVRRASCEDLQAATSETNSCSDIRNAYSWLYGITGIAIPIVCCGACVKYGWDHLKNIERYGLQISAQAPQVQVVMMTPNGQIVGHYGPYPGMEQGLPPQAMAQMQMQMQMPPGTYVAGMGGGAPPPPAPVVMGQPVMGQPVQYDYAPQYGVASQQPPYAAYPQPPEVPQYQQPPPASDQPTK